MAISVKKTPTHNTEIRQAVKDINRDSLDGPPVADNDSTKGVRTTLHHARHASAADLHHAHDAPVGGDQVLRGVIHFRLR